MLKISPKIYLALTTAICGLFCGCYDGETECFPPGANFYLHSTSDIDSVHFYLNNERICYEQVIYEDGLCTNCAKIKGRLSENIECRTSVEDESYSILPFESEYFDSCVASEEFPIWKTFDCRINEKRYKKSISSSKLTVYVFSSNRSEEFELGIRIADGNHYNIIAEQDTAAWYSYTAVTLRDYFDYYGPASAWKRAGCYDGYCVAILPMTEDAVCYDK